MGSLEEVKQGPDFKQSKKPSDHSTGRLWFNRDADKFSMADGVDYWGRGVPVFGYFVGGEGAGSSFYLDTNALSFSTEALNLLGNYLSVNRSRSAGFGDTAKGYVAGAYYLAGTETASIESLSYPVQAWSTLSASLSLARGASEGVYDRLAGYVLGGAGNTPSIFYASRIDKFVFSNESCGSLSSLLSVGKSSYGAESPVAGYSIGGDSGGVVQTAIEKIYFGADVLVSVISGLPQAVTGSGNLRNEEYDWCAGGLTHAVVPVSTIQRLHFTDDTTVSLVQTLASPRWHPNAVSALEVGYYSGGWVSTGVFVSDINRFTFSTETASTMSTSLFGMARLRGCGLEELGSL